MGELSISTGRPADVDSFWPTAGSSHISFSVVVPTHDEGRYLEQTVDSLLATLPADGDIIVVDDHSTDGSTDFLERATETVRRLRPAHRLGAVSARNVGARATTGEVLVFCDAHVVVPDGWAAMIAEAFEDPLVGIVGVAISDLEDPAWKGYGLRFVDDGLHCEWGSRPAQPVCDAPIVGAGFLAMRRTLFTALDGFDSGLRIYGMEDPDLAIRVWTLGYKCVVLRDVEVAHLFRPSHSFQSWEDGIHNMLRLGIVHFGEARLGRLITELVDLPDFTKACSHVATSDAWARRDSVQSRRVHDDDWYFDMFPMSRR